MVLVFGGWGIIYICGDYMCIMNLIEFYNEIYYVDVLLLGNKIKI